MSEDRRQRGARARGKASGAPPRLTRTAALLALVSIPALAVPSPSLEPETTAALQRNLGQAEQALDRGEMEIAESRLRSAAFEGLLLIGRSFMVAGKEDGDPQGEAPDLAAARDAFERASGLVVQPRRALFRLALVKLRQDEREAAIVTLRELLAADPADGQARRLLSQALVAGEEIEAAVAELAEGLAANPDDLETAFALATGWLRMGEIERGEALFERVLEARPLPQTRVLIGRTYRDFELYERARALLDAAVAEDPEVRRARYYLGTLTLLENGMDGLAEAIELFEAERLLSPTDLMNQLYLGSAQVESRQFERALPWLEQAAGWPAAAFHAERYRGRALVGLRRFEEAMAHLERALELADGASGRDLSEIHYQLGLATRAAGDREAAAGHFELAKRLGIELAEQHREEFASFLRDELGRTRTGSHRESKFIDPFGTGDALFESLDEEQLLGLRARVREQVAQAFMNLGVLKTREGAMDAAADLFARAAGESPSFPGVQRALGMASFSAGRFAQAAAPLEHALREEEAGLGDADRQALRRTLAMTFLNLARYDEVTRLLESDPSRPETPALEFTYALALVRSGRAAQAGPIFDRLLASGSAWPALHVLLGQARAQEGDFEAAEAALRHALSLDPQVAEAHSTLGDLMMRQGRLEEAESALRAELKAHPEDRDARYLLATVLDLHRKPRAAEAELRLLLDRSPRHGGARYLLGKVLLSGGDAASALEQLEAAVAITPQDEGAHYQLGLAYQRSGRAEDASRHFARFRELKAAGREPAP